MLKKIIIISFLGLLLSIAWFGVDLDRAQAASDRIATVPILLYHGIPNHSNPNDRYVVSAERFDEQMKQLRDWGYSTITIQQLVNHINKGHRLPPRPIVISLTSPLSVGP